MAASGAGNFYVIRQSGVSHSAVEGILVGLGQLGSGKKGVNKSLGTGKALLSQLRTVSFFLSVFRNSLSTGVRQGLLEIIRSCQDNNDVDRKILRTAMFILCDDLEHTTTITKASDKVVPFDSAEEAFIQYVAHEVANTTNVSLKTIIVTRVLGSITAMAQKRGHAPTHSAGLFRVYLNFLVDTPQQPNPQRKALMLNAVGAAFSAMRRTGEILTIDCQIPLLEALKYGPLTLQRHTLALIVHAVAQTDDVSVRLSWAKWLRGVLRDPTTNMSILKDGLASSYTVRICTVIMLTCGENDRWPQEAIDLLLDIMNLLTKAPLKFSTELITFITSPALSWRIFPTLENHQSGLVSLLCSTLTAYVRNVSLDDIYLPVLLRSCESMGRFLQQRPGFDAQHSNRIFSAHMVEKDGEALKALWIALRRLYRKAIAPKSPLASVPVIVRTVINMQQKGDAAVESIDPIYANENWAHDTNNLAQASQALPSPYIFSCLIRTLIWLAPDQRYCRKEHPILWHAFSEDLFSSWDILSSSSSSVCNIGDASNILQDLLAQLFSRVKSSMMVVDLDRDHIDSSSHTAYYKCRLCCEPQYIHALCTLTTATIRYALSPTVISLLPAIWSFIFGFASSTSNWKNALTLTDIWSQQLTTVILMMDEFISSASAYRRQLIRSVREEALVFLIHATELKTKLHLLLYKEYVTGESEVIVDQSRDSSSMVPHDFDDMFGANKTSTVEVPQSKSLQKEKVSLDKVWKEIGWEKIYVLVIDRYEAQSSYPSLFDSDDCVMSSNSTIAKGRFLLSLCHLSSTFDVNSNGMDPASGKRDNFVDADIAQSLHQRFFRVMNDLFPRGGTCTSLPETSSFLSTLISQFPNHSLENLLFSEVKEAVLISSGSPNNSIRMQKFSSNLLLGIFGNPNMSFEDVTPMILSTLPSENVIETDFDILDSTKGEARHSFMLNKRPSLSSQGQTSQSFEDSDIFGTTTAFDSSKKSESPAATNHDDFFDTFGSHNLSSGHVDATEVASADTVNATKRLSGRMSFSKPSVKQSSNTTNIKILNPNVSPSKGKIQAASQMSSGSSNKPTHPGSGPSTNNDDIFGTAHVLFPTSSSTSSNTSNPPVSSTQDNFNWDTHSFAPSTTSQQSTSSAHHHVEHIDDFSFAPSVPSTTTTTTTKNDHVDDDFAPTISTNHVAAFGTKPIVSHTVPKLQGPTSLTPPRDGNKIKMSSKDKAAHPHSHDFVPSVPTSSLGPTPQQIATIAVKDDDFFASIPTVPTPSSSASTPVPPNAASSNPNKTATSTFFGSDFDLHSVGHPAADPSEKPALGVTANVPVTAGLVSASSAADLDFLGNIGSNKATVASSKSSAVPTSRPVPSSTASSTTIKPLVPLPPPNLEAPKKPVLSGVAAARRQSAGTANKAPTNVAAIFDGLNFDVPSSSSASTNSKTQPPPKPTFQDDWTTSSTSWETSQKNSNSRRSSLNPPPVDPFATSTTNSAVVGFAPSTTNDFFAPTVASANTFTASTSTSTPVSNSWATTTSSQPLPANPFTASTTSVPPAPAPVAASADPFTATVPTAAAPTYAFTPSASPAVATGAPGSFAPSVPASVAPMPGSVPYTGVPYPVPGSQPPYPVTAQQPMYPPTYYPPQGTMPMAYPGTMPPVNYAPGAIPPYPVAPVAGYPQYPYPYPPQQPMATYPGTVPPQQQAPSNVANAANGNKPKNPFDDFR